MDKVTLVNEQDQNKGSEEKLKAHELGLLHRAFSIFIFNSADELLLQQRALNKYHSAGLWSNACCSHPLPDEDLISAAHRRLKEELGFDCDLQEKFSFIYKAKTGNLIEYEYDHVLIGKHNESIAPNPEEIFTTKWLTLDEIIQDVKNHPDIYSSWFKIIINDYVDQLISPLC